MNENDLSKLIQLEGITIEENMDPLLLGERGRWQLGLVLQSAHCLGSNEVPGPGGSAFWEDTYFSYTDALDENLDLYDRFLEDLSRKSN